MKGFTKESTCVGPLADSEENQELQKRMGHVLGYLITLQELNRQVIILTGYDLTISDTVKKMVEIYEPLVPALEEACQKIQEVSENEPLTKPIEDIIAAVYQSDELRQICEMAGVDLPTVGGTQ